MLFWLEQQKYVHFKSSYFIDTCRESNEFITFGINPLLFKNDWNHKILNKKFFLLKITTHCACLGAHKSYYHLSPVGSRFSDVLPLLPKLRNCQSFFSENLQKFTFNKIYSKTINSTPAPVKTTKKDWIQIPNSKNYSFNTCSSVSPYRIKTTTTCSFE